VPDKLAKKLALETTPYSRASLSSLNVSQDFIRYITSAGPLASLNIVALE